MTMKGAQSGQGSAADIAPVVVNIGKTKRSKIKKLERGEGPLMSDIDEVMAQVRQTLGAAAEGAQLVPVVIVYQKKKKRRGLGMWGM